MTPYHQLFTVTTPEEVEAYGQPIGAEIWIVPPPATFDEDFDRLKGVSQQFLEALKQAFHVKYAAPSVAIYDDELEPLYDFIRQAEAIGCKVAFETEPSIWLSRDKRRVIDRDHEYEYYEYLRLKHGYYKKHWCNGTTVNSTPMKVYVRYFLFKQWLEQQKEGLMPPATLAPPAIDRPPVTTYDTFPDLFKNPADVGPCVEVLRKYRPQKPVLGEGLTWVGSRKDRGLLVAWIERMEQTSQPKIHRLGDRKELVRLLNNYFANLSMGKDARVFGTPTDKDVKDRFVALMPD